MKERRRRHAGLRPLRERQPLRCPAVTIRIGNARSVRRSGPRRSPLEHVDASRRDLRRRDAAALRERRAGRQPRADGEHDRLDAGVAHRRQRRLGRVLQRPHRRRAHLQSRAHRDRDPDRHDDRGSVRLDASAVQSSAWTAEATEAEPSESVDARRHQRPRPSRCGSPTGPLIPEPSASPGRPGPSRILQNRCVGCHGPSGNVSPRLDEYEPARLAVAGNQAGGALAAHAALVRRRRVRRVPKRSDADVARNRAAGPVGRRTRAARGRAAGLGRTRAGDRARAPATLSSACPASTASRRRRIPSSSRPDSTAIGGFADGRSSPATPRSSPAPCCRSSSGGTLGTWTPWAAASLPEGVAYRLPARSTILLTVYYRRPDGPAVDASRVGLYFADRPRREVERLMLPCGSVRLPTSIDALAIRPAPGSAARLADGCGPAARPRARASRRGFSAIRPGTRRPTGFATPSRCRRAPPST